jgi:hypothetical protein
MPNQNTPKVRKGGKQFETPTKPNRNDIAKTLEAVSHAFDRIRIKHRSLGSTLRDPEWIAVIKQAAIKTKNYRRAESKLIDGYSSNTEEMLDQLKSQLTPAVR